MRQKFEIDIEIPSGIECVYEGKKIVCKKGGNETERKISFPGTEIKVEGNKVIFVCQKANKKDIANIRANISHIKNMFKGLENEYVYELEICFVHFPITTKIDGNKLIINNFLGEKVSRVAEIPKGVNIEVKGQKVLVSGKDLERTGQAAANIERATKISKRDRRVFQDGIFLVSKPRGAI